MTPRRHQSGKSLDSPIGILDSGLGGLTIWREMRRALPRESTIYIGDHAYQPYGQRSQGEIRRRARELIRFLLRKNVKLIVVGCNTATVAGIDHYRRWFPGVPIIGVVPVVKTAASVTKTKHFAVLSTPNTAASSYQKRLIQTFADGCTVENIGVADLVSFIESGESHGRQSALLHRFLDPLKKRNVDVVVLGCTHFPFIKDTIHKIMGDGVAIIDSGSAVARHTRRILEAEKLRAKGGKPTLVFYTTGDAGRVSQIATKLMGVRVRFEYARV